eukprot:585394-Prymnesium_polylepis.2
MLLRRLSSSGAAADQVLLRARGLCTSKEWQNTANGLRIREVAQGDQGDEPVMTGQAVRVEFAARLEDGREVAHAVKSFKLGNGSVCAAIEQAVVGMRVGDRKKLRAPSYMNRGPLLADVPSDAVRARMRLAWHEIH